MYFHNHGWSINRKNRTKKTTGRRWTLGCELVELDVFEAGGLGCSSTPSPQPLIVSQRGKEKDPPKWTMGKRTLMEFAKTHCWKLLREMSWLTCDTWPKMKGTWQIMMDLIRFGGFRSHGGVGWKAAHNAVARSFDLRHQWRVAPAAFLIFELQDG